jgi:hypothetical protein
MDLGHWGTSIPNEGPQPPNVERRHRIPAVTAKEGLETWKISNEIHAHQSSNIERDHETPATASMVDLEPRRMSITAQDPQPLNIERENGTTPATLKANLQPWKISNPIQGLQLPSVEIGHRIPVATSMADSATKQPQSHPKSTTPTKISKKAQSASSLAVFLLARPELQWGDEPIEKGFILRLQTTGIQENSSCYFSTPYNMSVLRRNLKTTEFFAWFGIQTGRVGVDGGGPAELNFTFKHSKLNWDLKVRTVGKGNEDDFRSVRRETLTQYDKARESNPGMKEFVVYVSDPSWR